MGTYYQQLWASGKGPLHSRRAYLGLLEPCLPRLPRLP